MPLKISDTEFSKSMEIAIRLQRRRTYVREESSAHQTSLNAASDRSKTNREFGELISRAFEHHELSEFSRITRSEVKIGDRETVAKWFHHKYFLPVVLRRGNSAKGELLNRESFFDRVAHKLSKSSSNNIQFLAGPIGVGKSTFICNLLYVRWEQF